MSDFYRFPAMAKLDELTCIEQMGSIISERREAGDALLEYELFRSRRPTSDYTASCRRNYGMELMDIIHATETALRMEFSDEEVERLSEDVIEKNRRRGYYGE